MRKPGDGVLTQAGASEIKGLGGWALYIRRAVISLLLAGCETSHQLEEKLLFVVLPKVSHGLTLVNFRVQPIRFLIICVKTGIANKLKLFPQFCLQFEIKILIVLCPDNKNPLHAAVPRIGN